MRVGSSGPGGGTSLHLSNASNGLLPEIPYQLRVIVEGQLRVRGNNRDGTPHRHIYMYSFKQVTTLLNLLFHAPAPLHSGETWRCADEVTNALACSSSIHLSNLAPQRPDSSGAHECIGMMIPDPPLPLGSLCWPTLLTELIERPLGRPKTGWAPPPSTHVET